MNGKPLAPRHGFPVRVVCPGVLGARSVKWLDRVTVSECESPCFYQQRDYKILPPQVTNMEVAEKYWSKIPSMCEMPINSCISSPESGSTVALPASRLVEVKGYAVPQGSSGPIVRVEVSGDLGRSWVHADLDCGGENASKWAWVLFTAKVRMSTGKGQTIYAKATDAAGNTQEEARSAWNVRGVGYNGYEAVVDLTVVETSRL
jgi:sulfite oxidase